MMPKPSPLDRLLADIRNGNLGLTRDPNITRAEVIVRYSHMFCEVCECNYREILVRFADKSVFTLCGECALDLRDVAEIFGLDCSLERFRTVREDATLY